MLSKRCESKPRSFLWLDLLMVSILTRVMAEEPCYNNPFSFSNVSSNNDLEKVQRCYETKDMWSKCYKLQRCRETERNEK